jgi:hypothetical protein
MHVTEEASSVFALSLLEPNSCQSAVAQLSTLGDWREAGVLVPTANGVALAANRPDVRNAQILSDAHLFDIYKEFSAKISEVILPLIKQLWRVEFHQHSEVQIVRYSIGGHYNAHADGGYLMHERYFTVICYLNDDFEGGGTSFPSLGYSAIPEPGKAIIFPSRFVHSAEPVITGEKFVLVTWVLGPPPVEWI